MNNKIKTYSTQLITSVSVSAGLHSWFMTNTQMQTLESRKALLDSHMECVTMTQVLKDSISKSGIRDSVIETRLDTLKLAMQNRKVELDNCLSNIQQGQNVEYNKNKLQDIMENQMTDMKDITTILNLPKADFKALVDSGFKTVKEDCCNTTK